MTLHFTSEASSVSQLLDYDVDIPSCIRAVKTVLVGDLTKGHPPPHHASSVRRSGTYRPDPPRGCPSATYYLVATLGGILLAPCSSRHLFGGKATSRQKKEKRSLFRSQWRDAARARFSFFLLILRLGLTSCCLFLSSVSCYGARWCAYVSLFFFGQLRENVSRRVGVVQAWRLALLLSEQHHLFVVPSDCLVIVRKTLSLDYSPPLKHRLRQLLSPCVRCTISP